MVTRKIPENNHFLIAFSFADKQRELTRAIAVAVEKVLGLSTVFLDEWYEYYLAGDDADLKLQHIYEKGCDLVVVCVSENYNQKPWTRVESRAIRARQMKSPQLQNAQGQYEILPIRVGDGEIDDICFNTIAPDARKKSADNMAQLIVDRHNLVLSRAGNNPSTKQGAKILRNNNQKNQGILPINGYTVPTTNITWYYKFDKKTSTHKVELQKLETVQFEREGEIRLVSVSNSLGTIETSAVATNLNSSQVTGIGETFGETIQIVHDARRGEKRIRLIESKRRVPLGNERYPPYSDPIYSSLYRSCLISPLHQCSGTRALAPTSLVQIVCYFDKQSYPATIDAVVINPDGIILVPTIRLESIQNRFAHIAQLDNLPQGHAFYIYWKWPELLKRFLVAP